MGFVARHDDVGVLGKEGKVGVHHIVSLGTATELADPSGDCRV